LKAQEESKKASEAKDAEMKDADAPVVEEPDA
jgi:hypothetical protein